MTDNSIPRKKPVDSELKLASDEFDDHFGHKPIATQTISEPSESSAPVLAQPDDDSMRE